MLNRSINDDCRPLISTLAMIAAVCNINHKLLLYKYNNKKTMRG